MNGIISERSALTIAPPRRGRNGQLGRSDHVESVAAFRLTPVECTFFSNRKVLDVVGEQAVFRYWHDTNTIPKACGGDHTVVLVEE